MVLCLLFFQKGAPTIFHLSELFFFPSTMLDCFHAKKSERETESKGERKERERERERKKERKKVQKKEYRFHRQENSVLYFPAKFRSLFSFPCAHKGLITYCQL